MLNWITILTLLVVAFFAFLGYKRGIVSVAVSVAAIIIAILAGTVITPSLTSYIKNNTKVYENIEKKIYKTVLDNEKYNSIYQENKADELDDSIQVDVDEVGKYESLIQSGIMNMSSALNLPHKVMDKVDYSSKFAEYRKITGDSSLSFKKLMTAILAEKIAAIVLGIIVYIAVFAALYIIMRLFIGFTGAVTQMPLLKQMNELTGMALGLLEGLAIVWLFYSIIFICQTSAWGQTALGMINANPVTKMIYDVNPVLLTCFRSYK